MKSEFKTEAQMLQERAEAEELVARIIAKTNTIPPKVNAGSYQMAVNYKEAAMAARRAAEAKQPRLAKLRQAWQSISFYYA